MVFDFDKTIIDCDSDNWVLDELGATELFNSLLPTMPWNPLMVCVYKSLNLSFNGVILRVYFWLVMQIFKCVKIPL